MKQKSLKMSLQSSYIKNEAKKNFKGWSKQGLEFLLTYELQEDVKTECKKAIDKL